MVHWFSLVFIVSSCLSKNSHSLSDSELNPTQTSPDSPSLLQKSTSQNLQLTSVNRDLNNFQAYSPIVSPSFLFFPDAQISFSIPKTSSPRILFPATYRLRIKLTISTYLAYKQTLTIQDVCKVTYGTECLRVANTDADYVPDHVSTPIRIEFTNTGSYSYVDYFGFFSDPVTLDISYLQEGGFNRQDYENIACSGIPSIQSTSNIDFFSWRGATSSYLFGYLLGPKNGPVAIHIKHYYSISVWMNDALIYQSATSKDFTLAHTFTSVLNKLYYFKFQINTQIPTQYSEPYELRVRWDFSDLTVAFSGNYKLYPTRIQNMPFVLISLSQDLYCDDSIGFKCISCMPLCWHCQENSGGIICAECSLNSSLINNVCTCDTGYYLSSSDIYNCKVCPDLSTACSEISGSPYCISCVDNASSISGECICNTGYYKPSLYPSCRRCEGMYKECQEVNGEIIGSSCVENAEMVLGKCECNAGYYEFNIGNLCLACENSCKLCSSENENMICRECMEHSELYSGECVCNDGYYMQFSNTKCTRCASLHCKTCREEAEIYKCTACNAPYVLGMDNSCMCDEMDFISIGDDCIPKVLELSITSSVNRIDLTFNKVLVINMLYSNLSLTISPEEIQSKLSIDYQITEDFLRYSILFTSQITLDTSISASISLKDTQLLSLSTLNYEISVPIYILGSILEDSDSTDSSSTEDTSSLPSDSVSPVVVVNKESTMYTYASRSSTATTSTTMGVSFFSFNFDNAWSAMNTVQIYSFLPLLQVQLPASLEEGLKAQSDYILFDNPMVHFLSQGKKPYLNALRFKYDGVNFIINAGKPILILFFLLFLHLISFILSKKSTGKLQNYSKSLYNSFHYSIYIRYFLQMYLELISAATISVLYPSEDSLAEILSYLISFCTLVICCILPCLLSVRLYSYKQEENEEELQKYGALLTGLDLKSKKLAWIYWITFLTRRCVLALSFHLLKNYPAVQLILCNAANWIVVAYLCKFRPFDRKIINGMQIVIEGDIALGFSLASLLYWEGMNVEIVGWGVFGLVNLCYGVHVGYMIYNIGISVWNKVRRRNQEQVQIQIQTQIQNQIHDLSRNDRNE